MRALEPYFAHREISERQRLDQFGHSFNGQILTPRLATQLRKANVPWHDTRNSSTLLESAVRSGAKKNRRDAREHCPRRDSAMWDSSSSESFDTQKSQPSSPPWNKRTSPAISSSESSPDIRSQSAFVFGVEPSTIASFARNSLSVTHNVSTSQQQVELAAKNLAWLVLPLLLRTYKLLCITEPYSSQYFPRYVSSLPTSPLFGPGQDLTVCARAATGREMGFTEKADIPNSKDVPVYSRKLFVGGLPTEVSNDYVDGIFRKYGAVELDWPREATHQKEARHYPMMRPNLSGYVFLIYEEEESVHLLLKDCVYERGQYFLPIDGPHMKQKPAHVRPWLLSSIDYISDPSMEFCAHRTAFIGGVARTTTAAELAAIMERSFGSVSYVGIDIDPDLKYPKGAARVVFRDDRSYISAIKGRFVKVDAADGHRKEVELKPYVLGDQQCDECQKMKADFFCGDLTCLQYFCGNCWLEMHRLGTKRHGHVPLVKVGEQTKLLSDVIPLRVNSEELVSRFLQA